MSVSKSWADLGKQQRGAAHCCECSSLIQSQLERAVMWKEQRGRESEPSVCAQCPAVASAGQQQNAENLMSEDFDMTAPTAL